MNWDISIGCSKQWLGRSMQAMGRRFSYRRLVLDGEALEYAGRLQRRYGTVKHEAQWGNHPLQLLRQTVPVHANRVLSRSAKKSL